MGCTKFVNDPNSEFEFRTITTYDAYGNVLSRSVECGAPDDDLDVAIVSWPSGAGEERVELDASMFHFEALDTDANLYCAQARFYDPEQGRWLSQDPMGFAAGDSNLFRYPSNLSKTIDPGETSPRPLVSNRSLQIVGGPVFAPGTSKNR